MRHLLATLVLFFTCLAASQENTLVGSWTTGDANGSLDFSFSADYEVNIHVTASDEAGTYTGFWFLDGNHLTIVLEDEEIFYEVLSLTPTALVLAGGGLEGELYLTPAAADRPRDPVTPGALPDTSDTMPTVSGSQQAIRLSDGLVGTWRYYQEKEFLTEEERFYFLPNRRYITASFSQVPGYEAERLQEEGVYRRSDRQLVLRPYCSYEGKTFDLDLQAQQLALSGRNILDEPFSYTYVLEAGAEATLAEMRAVEAERERLNQTYLARTPIGSIQTGTFVKTDLPVDSDPSNSYPDAVVFSEGELYTFVSEWSYVFDIYGQLQSVNAADIAFNTPKMATLDYSKGTYRDTAQRFFLPNGRFYSVTELYGTASPTQPPTPQTTVFWGKYRIENDTLVVEEDAGTVTEYLLLGGRRALTPAEGGTCYKEVTWATEELERQAQELGR